MIQINQCYKNRLFDTKEAYFLPIKTPLSIQLYFTFCVFTNDFSVSNNSHVSFG